jgi:uncharacterized protein (DUF983 family)
MIPSILKMKCPKCHQGNMFINSNPYKRSTVDKMPSNCPCCGENFMPEPSFYFGAMFISYGLGVAWFLLGFLVTCLLNVEGWVFLSIYTATLLMLWPAIFRYSRVIYLYLFVRYDKNACKHQFSGSL